MTPRAISKIRSTYAMLARDRDGLASELSARLGGCLSARPGSASAGAAVVALVDRLVQSLDRPDGGVPHLEALRDGHHWPSADYMLIGEALLDTVQARLASAFDDDARAAWAAAFVLAAEVGMHAGKMAANPGCRAPAPPA